MTSTDTSYDLIKEAVKTRWWRRKEKEFDEWVIEDIKWEDLEEEIPKPNGGFDACILLGSSFSVMKPTCEDLQDQVKWLHTFKHLLKPGGLFIIDHLNFDRIISSENPSFQGMFSDMFQNKQDISIQVLYVDNKPSSVILDYSADHVENK